MKKDRLVAGLMIIAIIATLTANASMTLGAIKENEDKTLHDKEWEESFQKWICRQKECKDDGEENKQTQKA